MRTWGAGGLGGLVDKSTNFNICSHHKQSSLKMGVGKCKICKQKVVVFVIC